MNILQKINREQDVYQFNYFGISDFATNYDIKELFDNIDIIREYYDSKDGSINDKDDFIDYLYLKKFTMFSDVQSIILDPYKEKFDTIIEVIEHFFSKYINKNLVKYLQSNATSLIKEGNYNIIIEVFDLCFKYHKACHETIMYIAKEKTYLLLNNFDNVKNIIIKYDDICSEILNVKHFSLFKQAMLKPYLKMLVFFASKVQYKSAFELIINEIISYSSEIFNSINEDNYLQYESSYREIYDFLMHIKHGQYILMEKDMPQLDNLKEKYLKKHGHEFSFEKIPVEKLLEFFKNEKNSLHNKFFHLTHSYNKDTKEFESMFVNIIRNRKPSLIDSLCSTSMPTNDYFTISLQDSLTVVDYVYFPALSYFVSKEKIIDLISIMAAVTEDIFKYYNLDFKELELNIDYNILLNLFIDFFKAHDENNHYLMKGLCFSIGMFEMALAEKILRNIYIVKNKELYIKNDWFSLGNLLNVNNETMVNLLGLDNIKIFSYYLIKCDNIGYNIRNNFAHYKNIKTDDFCYGKLLKITQIFICMINQLCLNISE